MFFALQEKLSRKFDKLLPNSLTLDGGDDFRKTIIPSYLQEEITVYDIGGGKNPLLSIADKQKMQIRVVGFDIDEEELKTAPADAYDEIICADIQNFPGKENADLILCCTVMEHVKSAEEAFKGLHSILKDGGKAVIFLPSKYAVFARLNLLLPEDLKNKLLGYFFGVNAHNQGFPAYYDKASLKDYRKLADKFGFKIIHFKPYYHSVYFIHFLPIQIFWRIWIMLFKFFSPNTAAETFTIVLEKNN